MEEKAERDFMTIRPKAVNFSSRAIHLAIAFTSFVLAISCEPDLTDDPIQYVHFDDIVINLTLPAYVGLASDGGHAYVGGGAKGIIIYRASSSSYLVFERNCSFQPNDACATVDAQVFDMKDSCCGSIFSYATGQPTSGPAWRPLNQYQTSLNGNMLTITDLLVE
jgi:hypothetical protein